MVNQQERLDVAVLGWLGGAIDGEGSIMFIKGNSDRAKKLGGRTSWIPVVSVCNTEPLFINRVTDIWELLKIPYYFDTRKSNQNPQWKMKFSAKFQGIRRCATHLPKIIPYLVSKREKALWVLEFCESRLATPFTNGKGTKAYTTRELELVGLVRKHPLSSETTRSTLL